MVVFVGGVVVVLVVVMVVVVWNALYCHNRRSTHEACPLNSRSTQAQVRACSRLRDLSPRALALALALAPKP